MDGIVLAIVGATLSAVLGGVGSSVGISYPGTKGAGVLAEKPNLFAKILIMTALPGSQGVYGLLIAISILSQTGLLGDGVSNGISISNGLQYLFAGLLMGLSGLFSGIFQGKVAASCIGAIARDESLVGRGIVLSVVIETYAIFGLLISILIINAIG